MRVRSVLPRLALGGLCLGLPLGLASAVHAADPAYSNQTVAAGVVSEHSPAYSESFLAGGAVGDFDNDGFVDLFHPTGGDTPDRLFMNNGDGTFTDRAAEWGVARRHRGTAAAVGDFNGDGFVDLYVTSLGPAGQDLAGRHILYENQGGTGFVDVALEMNVNQTSDSSDGFGAAWGDCDLDGDLDLAVAGWRSPSDGNRLFRNDGDTFVDITQAAGLGSLSGVFGFAPRFADMDGDLAPELIWIGDFSTSRYYINDGGCSFTEFTDESGMGLDGTEMGMTVADVDEDGDFDLYVTTISTNNLYLNQGDHRYVERADDVGVKNTGWGWATVSIDFDHDTLVDLVATTQSGRQYAFVNTTPPGGPLQFVEVAEQIGVDSSVSGRGLSNFDYDNDGDQDLVFFPHNGPVQLFRNDLAPGSDTNWLRVTLDRACSTDIAPNGIGARVRVQIGDRELIGRVDGGSNYLSQSEMAAHFGLESATTVDRVTVDWPNGEVTVVEDVASNQTLELAPESCGGIVCSLATDQAVYAPGDAITATTATAANAGTDPTTVRVQIGVLRPNGAVVRVFDVGGDGSLTLQPGQEVDLAPLDIGTIPPGAPDGDYALGCQIFDQPSGALLVRTTSDFEIRSPFVADE